MGTRNLTMVINKEGETKISQYGQWDGYPSGQGITILNFLRKESNLSDLQQKLNQVRFLGDEDKSFLEEYNKNAPQWSSDPDNRTPEQVEWFQQFMSRDIAGEILENITSTNNKEIVLRKYETEEDDILVEWTYVVDFKMNEFRVHDGLIFSNPIATYKLDSLPNEETFLKLETQES